MDETNAPGERFGKRHDWLADREEVAGVQEHARPLGQFGHHRLVVGQSLEAVAFVVAQVEGDVGDVVEERVDAFDEVGERLVRAGTALGVQGFDAEGAAQVNVPFELAQVVGEVALVGVGFAAGEIADVEAGKVVGRRPQWRCGPMGTDQSRWTGVLSVVRAEEFDAGEASRLGEVEYFGQEKVLGRGSG